MIFLPEYFVEKSGWLWCFSPGGLDGVKEFCCGNKVLTLAAEQGEVRSIRTGTNYQGL